MNRIDTWQGEPGSTARRLAWMGGATVAALLLALATAASLRPRSAELPVPMTSATAATAATSAATPVAPKSLRGLGAREAAAQYLQFEPNLGQAPKAVRYVSRSAQHSVEVYDDGMALAAPNRDRTGTDSARAQLRFIGASADARFEAREPAPGQAHYLIGSDASKWLHGVPRYRQLRRSELYPGIDLVYYSRGGAMEFDLVVKPGADPSRIRLHVGGAHAPVIAANGDLLLDGANDADDAHSALRLHRPVLYQNIDGQKKMLDARYVLVNERELSFELPAYDKRHALVIDPVVKLLYSTYLGGVHDDQIGGMALDAQGNAYVIGNSGSEDWPVSGNGYQTTRKGLGRYVRNVVVTKFDASGTLIYSTFLGGTTNDYGIAIAVDAAGYAYLTGNTTSPDFPVTAGAYQSAFKASPSAYLAVLSPDGSSLSYSTLYGGTGTAQGTAIALDASGAPVLAGTAGPGLTTTAGAYKTTLASGSAAFVARFSALAGGAPQLRAASYYGVDNPQPNNSLQGNTAYSLALDAAGAAWLTGQAFTANLPATAGAVQTAPAAVSANCAAGPSPLNSFAYVAKLSADFSALVYASYLSGKTEAAGATACAEFGRAIKLDAAGNVYVVGGTASATFPTTAGAVQASLPIGNGFGNYASFTTKLKPDGSAILWSTYFGGNAGSTFQQALAMDPGSNSVWTVFETGGGGNFPLTPNALQPVHGGGTSDAGVAQFDATTGALKYATFFGGNGVDAGLAIGVDSSGNAFFAGATTSGNLLVSPNAFQPALTAKAFDGSDWFFSVLGAGTIGKLSINAAGNSGDATVVLSGAGFQQGATCSLTRGVGIPITTFGIVNADGTQASCILPLDGATPGVYDIAVTNPDGRVFGKNGAFKVELGGQPVLSVQLIGRSKIRTGVPSKFTVTVTNSGNLDAIAVPLWIVVPASVDVALDPAVSGGEALFGPGDADTKHISVLIPRVLAGESHVVAMDLTAASDAVSLPLNVSVQAPWFRTLGQAAAAGIATSINPSCVTDPAHPEYSDCSGLYYNYALLAREPFAGVRGQAATGGRNATVLGSLVRPLDARARPLANGNCDPVGSYKQGDKDGQDDGFHLRPHKQPPSKDRLYNIGYEFGFAIGTINAIAAAAGGANGVAQGAATLAAGGLSKPLADGANCPVSPPPPPPFSIPSGGSSSSTGSGGSIDPNDMIGPAGDGSARHFIRAGLPFSYEIAFENQPTASLPAARVVITDQLDPAKVDLSTFTLGSIAFGKYTITVPPGLRSYATTYPIDATISVRVQGSVDSVTGLVKWTFDTIDPITKLPPSDPALGFLPPDTDGKKGQGYVTFSVAPKAGLADATLIANQASIVFDSNASIATPTWSNTFDLSAPLSKVQSLTPKVGTTSFDVSWSGSDAGSGIRNYTVYVSDSGAAFTPWLTQATATTATYAGTAGHSYAFYVIANDGAGNTESAKALAEASITVAGTFADDVPASDGGGGCTLARSDRPSQRDLSLPLLLLAAFGLLLRRRQRASSKVAA